MWPDEVFNPARSLENNVWPIHLACFPLSPTSTETFCAGGLSLTHWSLVVVEASGLIIVVVVQSVVIDTTVHHVTGRTTHI